MRRFHAGCRIVWTQEQERDRHAKG
jgi:hypothetical protein